MDTALLCGSDVNLLRVVAHQLGACGKAVRIGSKEQVSLRVLSRELREAGVDVTDFHLDPTDRGSVDQLKERLFETQASLTVVVNDQVSLSSRGMPILVQKVVGSMVLVTRTLLPILQSAPSACVVNVLAPTSKESNAQANTAIGLVTQAFARTLEASAIKVNAVPAITELIVRFGTLKRDGPTGHMHVLESTGN